MINVDLDSSVPDWLIEYPRLLTLFESIGIDYCCGGKSLRTACLERGLLPPEVLARCDSSLNQSADEPTGPEQ
jgi:iron-sulfur cluster repair protein YtfE (RIC family)